MQRLSFAFLLGTALAVGGLSWAQTQTTGDAGHGTMDRSAMGHTGHAAMAENPAVAAYRAANDRMHADMAIAYTGDADVDFMKGMIPHHQGAIEMARVVLEHGTDPEIRALAEGIMQTQEAEIVQMRGWLAAQGY